MMEIQVSDLPEKRRYAVRVLAEFDQGGNVWPRAVRKPGGNPRRVDRVLSVCDTADCCGSTFRECYFVIFRGDGRKICRRLYFSPDPCRKESGCGLWWMDAEMD